MIHKLTIHSQGNLPLSYWKDKSSLTSLKEVSFQPGVNILYGKSLSGKTSILRLLAYYLYAHEDGRTTLSPVSHRAMFPYVYPHDKDSADKQVATSKSFTVEHDNQGVSYTNFTPKERSYKATPTIEELFVKFPPRNPISIVVETYIPDSDKKIAEEFLKTEVLLGAPTIILDSPDAGMDLIQQFDLWQKFSQVRPEDYQLIVATNSAFVLDIPGFNYIELTPGYYSMAKSAVNAWAEELNDNEDYSMSQYRMGKEK